MLSEKIENGFPLSSFTAVRDRLGLTDKEMAALIRVPKSTLATRKKRGRFSFEESERILRLQRLLKRALDVFGSQEEASRWLKESSYALGDISPLECAKTEIGAREVENLLGRVEHGVFS